MSEDVANDEKSEAGRNQAALAGRAALMSPSLGHHVQFMPLLTTQHTPMQVLEG